MLSVLLFHVGLGPFYGGYVGVDIFFVISGYLITRNIVAEVRGGRFSFGAFYMRRARRLLPAAFFVLFISLMVGSWLLTPKHLEAMGVSTLYALFSVSNIYFWQSSGYWDAAAEVKPLLHFWSLGVEEQFYFVWPALLALIVPRLRGPQIIFFLIVLGILSLLASEYFLGDYQGAVFYFTPFRAFEFCLGAILVWAPPVQRFQMMWREFLLLSAFVLMAISIFKFDESTRFPGVHALLPAAGAAIAIYVSGAARHLSKVLTNRVAVLVGKFSYSIYLIHWPIIVFYKYWKFSDLVLFERILIAAVSIVGGALMFRLVEQPFRYPKKDGAKNKHAVFVGGLIGCAAVISLPAYGIWQSGGWGARYESARREALELDRMKIVATYRSGICYTGGKDVLAIIKPDTCLRPSPLKDNYLLVGDSYAAHLYPGLLTAFPDANILQANYSSCVPTLFSGDAGTPCETLTQYLYEEYLPKNKNMVDAVILSARWSRDDVEPLRKTIHYLKKLGVTPIVFGRSVEYIHNLPAIFVRKRLNSSREDMAEFVRPNLNIVNAELEKMTREERVVFFNPYKAFCDSYDSCLIAEPPSSLLQWDNGHLTPEGSVFLIKQFKDRLGLPGVVEN